MKPTVYLAGAIAGLSGPEAIGWRGDAADYLGQRGVETLSPMRGKLGLASSLKIGPCSTYAHLGPFYTPQGIMARDYNDVKRCDALLVNLLGLTKPSLGTTMELAWAYMLQKPAVVVMEKEGNPHDNHPMLMQAMPFRVETLDEGIDAIAVILGR